MDYKKSYRLFHQCLLVGFAIIVANAFLDIWWLFVLGFVIVIGGIKQVPKFCRCPQCGGVIDVRNGKQPQCQHCGGALEW